MEVKRLRDEAEGILGSGDEAPPLLMSALDGGE
jgi:hypothetical protein